MTYADWLSAEVVLVILLANFKFELGKENIVWNSAGVAYPAVGEESTKPEMPMKVSILDA